jgi:quinoprotein glucose dehydrogenase
MHRIARPRLFRSFSVLLLFALAWPIPARVAKGESSATGPRDIFARDNLVAWCIVPFDAKKRTPAQRAEMLERIGLRRYAYDWRDAHLPTFDVELTELERHHIELTAVWFPDALNKDARALLDGIKKHGLKTQLWVTSGIDPAGDQKKGIDEGANRIRPIAREAAGMGCRVALYNHGGWFGEPENQIAIIEKLNAEGITNVGIVYNLHHGHDHLARFPALLEKMKPYLLAVNLNGMNKAGGPGEQILPLGQGELDLQLLKTIRDSGYAGPIGLLNHTDEDAEGRLLDNLDGLEWLRSQLDGKPAGPRPEPRTWHPAAAKPGASAAPSLAPEFGKALSGGMVVEGKDAYRNPPITVECRAALRRKAGYNILVASETKASAAHWEIFTMAGDGKLTAYLPGYAPDHVRTGVDLCDGAWHFIAMQFESERVRLYADGKLAADEKVKSKGGSRVPGGLAFGRLVEGGIGCDGLIDDVRISRGAREITGVPKGPLGKDEQTLGLWSFDDLPTDPSSAVAAPDYWAVEDPAARERLPKYQTIPAARPDELTAPNGWPPSTEYADWYRSHGNDACTRYSPLTQIDRTNVKSLKVAWTYHSNDGKGNIQCNPIIVDGVMYAPTVGECVVAIDAQTGNELWRFKPGGRPAHRGITFHKGAEGIARLLFTAGNALWALDPKTGKPIEAFGTGGKVAIPECVVAPAVYQNVIVFAGWTRDVFGHDLTTGKLLWTFHTVPHAGEPNARTWDKLEEGANCWGGMALDSSRGIAYVTTGSPKPNFIGAGHQGDNLYGNCILALDALTGERLWHFQEIRHDVWDLDVAAPPVLVTVMHEGRKVDAVAAATKIGNTLLVDRVTGKPLFPFRLRRAPAGTLRGERMALYQPDVELPEPFSRQVFTEDDVTNLSTEAHKFVMRKIAGAKFGWFESFDEGKPLAYYGLHGGAEWTGAAFDPQSGLLYVTSNELPWTPAVYRSEHPAVDETKLPPTAGRLVYQANCMPCHGPSREGVAVNPSLLGISHRLKEEDVLALLKTGRGIMPAAPQVDAAQRKDLIEYLFERDRPNAAPTERPERPSYRDSGYPKLLDANGYPGCKPPWGLLNAIDLNTGKIAWRVPLGEYDELTRKGIPKTGTENFGGATVTAGGLVFCGGTRDIKIRAFDKSTGEELWSHPLPFGGFAPPAVYQVHGKQYLVIPATGGGKLATPMGDAYVAFTLP